MKKQIVYCNFIPRLFSVMLDLILIAGIVNFITMLIINFIVLGIFQEQFLLSNVKVHDTHFDPLYGIYHAYSFVSLSRFALFYLIKYLINIIIMGGYFVFFWKKFNATPGKMLMKMKIVDADDFSTPSTYRFVKRYLGYYTTLIGMWSILTNKRKMSLHDKIANTIVIKS